MGLDQQDLQRIEQAIDRLGGDIAAAIGRGFERLENRIDATESRLYSRFAEVEERVEGSRQDLSDEISPVRESVHELSRRENEIVPLQEA